MNHDNILSKVTRVTLSQPVSKKTNQPYNVMDIHFVNGYQHKVFLNNEQLFAIKDALKTKSDDNLLDPVD